MAQLVPLQDQFDRVIRDVSRDRLPRGACWDLVDYVPNELGAPISKRGGWSYFGQVLTGIDADADRVRLLAHAPFDNGDQVVGILRDDAGAGTDTLVWIKDGDTPQSRSTCGEHDNWVFYRDGLYLFGGGAPQLYGGASNVANLTGSPPNGKLGTAYKDHLVLANATETNRVWFSGAGDATSWDTSNGFIDTNNFVTGIYPLRNQLLIWHNNGLERIIGSIPPPGTDMYLQPVFDSGMGVNMHQSLAGTDEFVIWSNPDGVYMTDGSSVVDLTAQGGIKSFWQAQTAGLPALRISGGFYRGYYVCVITNGWTNIYKTTLLCHVSSRRWFRFSNLQANAFARRTRISEELYFGLANEPRAGSISSCFDPSSTVKNDADGDAVAPVLETRFFRLGRSKGRVKTVYANYDVRDSASDNPTLTVSALYSPESTSYTALSPTLSESTEEANARVTLNKRAFGFGLKLAQTNASSATRIYNLAADAHPREPSALS